MADLPKTDRGGVDILELFRQRKAEGKLVTFCAPMVRYSKLPFRALVRNHGVDVACTPMMVSDSFIKSAKARAIEFSTNRNDRPLVAQFAACSASELSSAAHLIAPYVDAIDLNCGCPQRWAMQEGYGAILVERPELVADMVRQARTRTDTPVSVKIRLTKDDRRTVDVAQRAERAGAAWISVHGRTHAERTVPVHNDKIKLVKDSVTIPVVANGDINTLADAERVQRLTGVDGVMSARGLLANPALFDGVDTTPKEVVTEFVHTALAFGSEFSMFHHHLMYMLDRAMGRSEKREFNRLATVAGVLDYLEANHGVVYSAKNPWTART